MKYVLGPLYRVWFYVLVAFSIILLLPVLTVSVLKASWYPLFFKIAQVWAKLILFGMGLRLRITHEEFLVPGKSYVLVANHTSMIDIMTMLATIKEPFVFVGKKELIKLPLFGFFYKRTSILVDRKSISSRQSVYRQAQQKIDSGLSICIFPEGGVPEDASIVLDTFKDGAFRLAQNHKLPIVPIAFLDNKKRFSYSIFTGGPGVLRTKVHHFIAVDKLHLKARELRQEARRVILNTLNESETHKTGY